MLKKLLMACVAMSPLLGAEMSARPFLFVLDGLKYYTVNSEVAQVYAVVDSTLLTTGVIVPETVEYAGKTMTVEQIGSSAFANCPELKSISLPKTIRTIGTSAFAGSPRPEGFTWPDSLREIRDYAFDGCDWFESLTDLPDSLRVVAGFAKWASLREVVLPKGVTEIGQRAFAECKSLESIAIPKGVTTIKYGAFSQCENLRSCVLPEGITLIEYEVFSGCKSLKSVTIPKGITEIKMEAFAGCKSLLSAAIPEGVTAIGQSAFSECESLQSVTLPEKSLQSIGAFAFAECQSLTKANVPASVELMGNNVWLKCRQVEAIDVAAGNPYWKSVDGVVYTKSGKWLHEYPYGRKAERFVMPEGVDSLSAGAFYGNPHLRDVTLCPSVRCIGPQAFMYCESLENVELSESLETVLDNAFSGCDKLRSLHLPAKVDVFNGNPFGNAFAEYTVDPENQTYKAVDGVLYTKDGKLLVGYPSARADEVYEAPVGLTDCEIHGAMYLKRAHLPEGIVNMNFTENELLETVNIPSTVTSLGSMAFGYCPSLVEIVIPATVTEIDSDAALFSFSKLKRLVLEGKYADYRWMRPNKWRPADGGDIFTEPSVPDGCVVFAHESEFDAIRACWSGELRPLDEWTGIEAVEADADAADAVYYDLQGRRVAAPAAGGVYLRVMPDGRAAKVRL